MGKRAFIVTQSIKKLRKEDKELAQNGKDFRRLSDHRKIDLNNLEGDETDQLYYKEIPYTSGNPDQRPIITYSPKYAAYQKSIRDAQVERAKTMIQDGSTKKNRKKPNDLARFIDKPAATKNGEAADIHYYLDEEKILEESEYDGLYAVCTDLLDDEVGEILKVSEGRCR